MPFLVTSFSRQSSFSFRSLVRVRAQADAIRILARFIAPSLPSFNAAFTAAQPLTRIRDIAHRNDIPMELKNVSTERKETEQRKAEERGRGGGLAGFVDAEADV